MQVAALFVDTNIFLRIFAADDERMTADCRRLIESAESGALQLFTSHLAMAEIVWVLQTQYGASRADVSAKLRDLLTLRSLRIDQKEMLQSVVELYSTTSVDFIDAYNALDARRRGIERVCSYDHDFDALPVQRVEPADVLN